MSTTLPAGPLNAADLERYGHALAAAPYAAVRNHRDHLVALSFAGDDLSRQLLPFVVTALHDRPEEQQAAQRREVALAEGAAQLRRRRSGLPRLLELRAGTRRLLARRVTTEPDAAHQLFEEQVRRLTDDPTTAADARLILREDQ